jgi:hypothetical protein
MPTQTGLPPLSQRPQIVSRFEVPTTTNQVDPTQVSKEQQETGVQGLKTQVAQRSQEASIVRFPFETQVERFRGDIEGRSVRDSLSSTALSALPKRVVPFNPLTEQSLRVGSLSSAESAALGLRGPQDSKESSSASFDFPSIAGSGEILARIEENTGGETALDQATFNVGRGVDVEEDQSTQNDSSTLDSSPLDPSSNKESQSAIEGNKDQDKKAEDSKPGEETKANGDPLTESEKREVDQLETRDQEVRQHEQAHVSAGGRHIRGGIKYDYTQGPNGKRYAVGGEVDIDLSPENTPEATITKMQQVRQAALAPAEPSGADRSVASAASQREQQARSQLAEEQQQAARARSEEVQQNVNTEDQATTKAVEGVQSTEGIDSSESLAGAQSVPSGGGPTQKKLNGYESSYAMASHESHPMSSHESYPMASPSSRPVSQVHVADSPQNEPSAPSAESLASHESYPMSSHESYPMASPASASDQSLKSDSTAVSSSNVLNNALKGFE